MTSILEGIGWYLGRVMMSICKSWLKFSLVLLSSFWLATSATSAQEFVKMAMPRFPLLMDRAVLKELKVTPEQEQKIKDLLGSMFQEMPVEVGAGGGGKAITIRITRSNDDNDGGGGSISGMPDINQIDKDINKILDEKQVKRLDQIHLQRQGYLALQQEKYIRELKITKEQKALLDDIFQIHQDSMMKLLEEMRSKTEGGGLAMKLDSAAMKELKEKTDKGVELVLTPEQIEKWKEMQGPKFETKR